MSFYIDVILFYFASYFRRGVLISWFAGSLDCYKEETGTGYRVIKDLLRAAINVVEDADRQEIMFLVPNARCS